MSNIQVIEKDGVPAFYVLPASLWERVRDAVEEAEDAADLELFDRADDGTRIPLEVLKAEMDGDHPVRAWREYKGLTLQALADSAKVSKAYLSQIECGKRVGTTATLKKLAVALGVPINVLAAN